MQACALLNIQQAFTSYNNPKGNADTERMMRTLKEELVWLQEWPDHHTLSVELGQWIQDYSHSYLHSALGYRTPDQIAREFTKATRTPLEIACQIGEQYNQKVAVALIIQTISNHLPRNSTTKPTPMVGINLWNNLC